MEIWFRVLIALINLLAFSFVCVVIAIVCFVESGTRDEPETSGIVTQPGTSTQLLFSAGTGFWVLWVIVALELYTSVFSLWELHKRSVQRVFAGVRRWRATKRVNRRLAPHTTKTWKTIPPVAVMLVSFLVPTLELIYCVLYGLDVTSNYGLPALVGLICLLAAGFAWGIFLEIVEYLA
jgi:hypothetical protein